MHDSIGAPQVFLSHASEDKERFVIDFATRLRGSGVDVWLDHWEMYPGDSLVDKIFEEGLRSAQAVIIVLSRFSVEKKWVREELNVGVVSRISKGTRLIPVVLDGVAVPEALKSTVWISVSDLTSYEPQFDRIVASIFGSREKPALGEAPSYASSSFRLPGVSQRDAQVLKIFCDRAVAKDALLAVNTTETAADAAKVGIPEEQFLESAEVLVEFGYLEVSKVLAPVPPYFTITTLGFEQYVHSFLPGYDKLASDVVSEIVNNGLNYNQEIMKALGREDYVVVDHILDVLSSKGLVELTRCIGHHTYLSSVSPRLKRMLEATG